MPPSRPRAEGSSCPLSRIWRWVGGHIHLASALLSPSCTAKEITSCCAIGGFAAEGSLCDLLLIWRGGVGLGLHMHRQVVQLQLQLRPAGLIASSMHRAVPS